EPDHVSETLPACLISIEKSAFQLSPQILRHRSDWRRADKAGVLAPGGLHALQLVFRHQHIAVRHQHPVVAAGVPALDEIVEFWIGAHRRIANQKSGIGPWMRCKELNEAYWDGRP